MRGNLFTAILAATLATYFLATTTGSATSAEAIIRRSRKSLDPKLVRYARQRATAANTDPDFVEAVLIAENLQRPKWIRTIENAVGRVIGIGSYGIMQVQQAGPISDKDSIDITLSAGLANMPRHWLEDDGYPSFARVRAATRNHNGDPDFLDLVWALYEQLHARGSDEMG